MAVLKWRHKLFFGIYLQIPETIRTEKARFQKKFHVKHQEPAFHP